MRIRMKVDVSGARDGQPWPPRGQVVDLPDGEAADLCAAGLAEPVAEVVEAEEVAVEPEPEQRAVTTETAAAVVKGQPAVEPKPRRGRPPKSVGEG